MRPLTFVVLLLSACSTTVNSTRDRDLSPAPCIHRCTSTLTALCAPDAAIRCRAVCTAVVAYPGDETLQACHERCVDEGSVDDQAVCLALCLVLGGEPESMCREHRQQWAGVRRQGRQKGADTMVRGPP